MLLHSHGCLFPPPIPASNHHVSIVACYATEDAIQIGNWFYYNVTVRNYNPLLHSLQLLHANFFTLSAAVLTYLQHRSHTSLTELHAPNPRCTITHKVS
jgi:hypothetical protein